MGESLHRGFALCEPPQSAAFSFEARRHRRRWSSGVPPRAPRPRRPTHRPIAPGPSIGQSVSETSDMLSNTSFQLLWRGPELAAGCARGTREPVSVSMGFISFVVGALRNSPSLSNPGAPARNDLQPLYV